MADGSLTETIYAGAGAGTGKTQALVERIANLVTRGGVRPENIAAITFTVAAASELRQRVREELEKRLEQARAADGRKIAVDEPVAGGADGLDLYLEAGMERGQRRAHIPRLDEGQRGAPGADAQLRARSGRLTCVHGPCLVAAGGDGKWLFAGRQPWHSIMN
ncbi:MAG: UvrD-helicase domain-containing protein [Proteobacteria bacterium]|nr:UvrD-helicase domain-containing protein [Pseudomonadota bacterium]